MVSLSATKGKPDGQHWETKKGKGCNNIINKNNNNKNNNNNNHGFVNATYDKLERVQIIADDLKTVL